MAKVNCTATPCPIILSSACVYYEGQNLIYTGINTNDSIEVALEKIENLFHEGGNSFKGSSGTSGTSGLNGTSGTDGTSGTSGSSGISGTSGTSGIDGTSGTSGSSGTSSNGTSGTSGINGTSGTSSNGTSGTSGINGTSGTSGNGTSGTSGSSGGVTILNDANNRLITATGTSGTVNAEANLIFDGQLLDVTGDVITNSLKFDLINTGTAGVGIMRWNDGDGTVDLGLKGGNVTLQIGQEQHYPLVRNTQSPAQTLIEGTLVMIDPNDLVSGQRLNCVKAITNNGYTSKYQLGILTENIASGQTGFCTWFGHVRNLSASAMEAEGLKPVGEPWLEGEILYPNPAVNGGMTTTMPDAPYSKSYMAIITNHTGNNIDIFVRPSFGFHTWEADDIKIFDPNTLPNDSLLTWNLSNKRWEQSKVLSDYVPFSTIDEAKTLTGWLNGDSIVVTYNYTNRTITLAGDLRYQWRGKTYTLTSPWTSSAHTATVGNWFLYSTDGINFTWQLNNSWQFTDIMVAYVRYRATAAESFAIREVHGMMDEESHEEFHSQIGTYRVSGGQATAGSYTENTPTNSANSPGFDQASVKDEDCVTTIPVWVKGMYTTMYVGPGNTSVFNLSATLPFIANAADYIQVNNVTTGTMSPGINNRYYNVYQIMMPVTSDSDSQKYRTIMLQPQTAFTSLASAQAEDVRTLNLGALNSISPEFVLYTRITYVTSAGDLNDGKCRIATNGVSYVIGSRAGQVSVTGFTTNNHATLSNLIWTASGHVDLPNKVAGFDGAGAATLYDIPLDGTSGTSGTSGNGTSGTSGTNGTSGTSGSGTSGTSGSNGTSGTSGASGTSGTSSSMVVGAQEGHLTPGLTGSLSGASGLFQGLSISGTESPQAGVSSPFIKYQPGGYYQDPMGFFTGTTYGITASAKPIFYARFSRQTSTPYHNLKIGLSSEGTDNAGYSSSQSNIILKYNYATDTTLKFAVSNGATATVVDTGVAWTTEVYTVYVDASNPASIIMKLYDDDKTELFSTTVTTNIPTAKLGFVFKMYDYAYGATYSLYLYAAKIITQL